MLPFIYQRAENIEGAINAASDAANDRTTSGRADIQFLAGGTTLIDLMKLNVMRPDNVIDIGLLRQSSLGQIIISENGLRLGALVRMSEAVAHPIIRRNYPMIAQSLEFSASAQLRNMASLGGNVLQRTRCNYFRDVSYPNCNKRIPGSGCAALDGFNRHHAVLGTSQNCIATYPGDFAQALVALDAQVEISGPNGTSSIPFAELHRIPGTAPHIETILTPGELITAFDIPAGAWTRRSLYLKIRDRESYEFALASAAVALDLNSGRVRQARIALGGVATVPWRAREAEKILEGRDLNEPAAKAAADAAFQGAIPRQHNAFKITLGKRTLFRALHEAASMDV